jgi:large subunit ribosomal protein L3
MVFLKDNQTGHKHRDMMTLDFQGRKRGMIQLFDETGRAIPCTVIEAAPNVVTQVKTTDRDGYNAIQLGFEDVKPKQKERWRRRRISKAEAGHCEKAGTKPKRNLKETRVESTEAYELGNTVSVATFKDVKMVDVTGTSKGKGFQGVIKCHNFAGGPATHGSGFHRTAGSLGMRSTPGWVFKGGKMPKRLGGDTVTIQSLEIVRIDEDEDLIVVKGAIPGANNGLVSIKPAVKRG